MELDNAGEYEDVVLRVATEWAGSENRTSPDNIPWFDSNAFYDGANAASTWCELGRLERLSLAIANIAPYSAACVEGVSSEVEVDSSYTKRADTLPSASNSASTLSATSTGYIGVIEPGNTISPALRPW
jgi:hypothetical protein